MIHCFVARYEADGYECDVDWINDHLQLYDDERLLDDAYAICLLEEGHEGPHKFVTSSQIVVSFSCGAGRAEPD